MSILLSNPYYSTFEVYCKKFSSKRALITVLQEIVEDNVRVSSLYSELKDFFNRIIEDDDTLVPMTLAELSDEYYEKTLPIFMVPPVVSNIITFVLYTHFNSDDEDSLDAMLLLLLSPTILRTITHTILSMLNYDNIRDYFEMIHVVCMDPEVATEIHSVLSSYIEMVGDEDVFVDPLIEFLYDESEVDVDALMKKYYK